MDEISRSLSEVSSFELLFIIDPSLPELLCSLLSRSFGIFVHLSLGMVCHFIGKYISSSLVLRCLCEVSYINNEIKIYILTKNSRIDDCLFLLIDILK